MSRRTIAFKATPYDQFRHPGGRLNRTVQTPVRVNVTCVTPLGEEMASIS